MRPSLLLALACSCALAACGSDDAATVDAAADIDAAAVDAAIDAGPDAAIDAPAGPFALTSTAFMEGMRLPMAHACDGANVSPPLAWTAGPAGTLSYAIVMADTFTGQYFIHSIIYDIPAARTSLPLDVDKTYQPADVPGAHQTRSYDAQVVGYNGPCGGAAVRPYRFTVYALDVALLPGATAATVRADANNLILAHDLAAATLSATYSRP